LQQRSSTPWLVGAAMLAILLFAAALYYINRWLNPAAV
jgi:hypothetical protein